MKKHVVIAMILFFAAVLTGCGLSNKDLTGKYHISTDVSLLESMIDTASRYPDAQNKETYFLIDEDGVGTIKWVTDESEVLIIYIFDTRKMKWHLKDSDQSYPFSYKDGIITMDHQDIITGGNIPEVVIHHIVLTPFS